jgi:hypothetical protein
MAKVSYISAKVQARFTFMGGPRMNARTRLDRCAIRDLTGAHLATKNAIRE